jgi:nucleoside-diphosphate-sugar epimerase
MTKKILVTGSQGFLGKALVNELRKNSSYQVHEIDVHNCNLLKEKLIYNRIDHIFHLAAKTFVPDSWENPNEFYEVNIIGTNKILDLCRLHNANLTFVSAYVYGTPLNLPISEQHQLNVSNPYMHSKVLAESLCSFYSENFSIKTTIIRPFNIYGINQRDDFLIPKIIKQVLNNNVKKIQLNSVDPKRDFIFLDDVIRALLLTMGNRASMLDIYNVGAGESISINNLIKKIFDISKIEKELDIENIIRKNEIMDVVADITKIEKELGWRPIYNIDEGLKQIINYEQNKNY